LFYRLNVFPLELPPLRERTEDLPGLIADLLAVQSTPGARSLRLSQEALTSLGAYAWPGNVRELANLLERLSILFPQRQVRVQDLPHRYRCLPDEAHSQDPKPLAPPVKHAVVAPHHPTLPPGGIDLKSYLSSIESSLIRAALAESNGIVADAARLLGVQRSTLVEKLRKATPRVDTSTFAP
jgi:sigma-54 specific flagellar transcriptional regulator A